MKTALRAVLVAALFALMFWLPSVIEPRWLYLHAVWGPVFQLAELVFFLVASYFIAKRFPLPLLVLLVAWYLGSRFGLLHGGFGLERFPPMTYEGATRWEFSMGLWTGSGFPAAAAGLAFNLVLLAPVLLGARGAIVGSAGRADTASPGS